ATIGVRCRPAARCWNRRSAAAIQRVGASTIPAGLAKVAVVAPAPGATRSVADRTSSCEDSRSAGYARSPLLTLWLGSGESTRRTPSPTAVISRQPTWSVRNVFSTETAVADPSLAGALRPQLN